MARDELREASEKFQTRSWKRRTTDDPPTGHVRAGPSARSDGRIGRGPQEYASMAKKWPKGRLPVTAEARAKDLEGWHEGILRLAGQVRTAQPVAKEPGTPGARPDFLSEPDAAGMLKLPSARDSRRFPRLTGRTSAAASRRPTKRPTPPAPGTGQAGRRRQTGSALLPSDEKPADESPERPKPARRIRVRS